MTDIVEEGVLVNHVCLEADVVRVVTVGTHSQKVVILVRQDFLKVGWVALEVDLVVEN